MLDSIFSRLDELYPEMVDIRRDLHMYPELGFEEVRTPQLIADYLRDLGLDVTTAVGGRGVIGRLVGGKPGKTVGIRADFDALPIEEQTDVAYKSKVPGKMHACGHDAHTAIVLGLAKAFTEKRSELKGNIVFIHQHAEEINPGGAKAMMEDGCLDGIDAVFATHMENGYPIGTIGYREGYIMAATDDFEIKVIGEGGHAQDPQQTKDALVIGAQIVCNLQHIVSRRVNPLKTAVVSIGSFHSGSALNVVNAEATIAGTVRTFDEDIRKDIEQIIEEITAGTCTAARASYELTYRRGYPATWNHPKETKLLIEAAKRVVDEKNVVEMEPIMGGEDFSYFLQKVPGTYFFTGSANGEIGATYPYHHPKFNIDERALLIGAKTLASATLQFLHEQD